MIDQVLSDVSLPDLSTASQVAWREARNHDDGAGCECPAIEVLCKFYELGYRLVKDLE